MKPDMSPMASHVASAAELFAQWRSRLIGRFRLSALIVVGIGMLLTACTSGGGGAGTPTPSPKLSPMPLPFRVASVDLAVSPDSIAGLTCGSRVTFTYTATFHLLAPTIAGVIEFNYTLNNGRSQTPASVAVPANSSSQTFTFTSFGALPEDHTYPGLAIVQVTNPNTILSPAVKPSGTCVTPGPFKVTQVSMAVSPSSISGLSCGSFLTVTYTATFTLAPNGPGGVIKFVYTINNGRGDNPAQITVAAGQTTATYSFKWSGNLPADHFYPEGGGVIVETPNLINSPLLAPTGACS